MKMLGDYLMLHRQDYLDQPGNPGGRFQMANISLDRTYQQRTISSPPLPKHRRGRLHFDRITQAGPSSVRLQINYFLGSNSRAADGSLNNLLLRNLIRHGQAGAGAILVNGAT